MQLYIELFSAKDSWLALGEVDRARYFSRAGSSIARLLEQPGVELVGVGRANADASNDAGYDYFAVWKLADDAHVRMLERGIEDDDWYGYFEQVNAYGELQDLQATMARLITS